MDQTPEGLERSPFLREALALGDRQPVVAVRSIYNSNRLKLVSSGTRVTSALYERIVNHRLLEPLEHCLAVENPVKNADLADRARELVGPGGSYGPLTHAVPRAALIAPFTLLALPAAIAFKLTVARERRPRILRHGMDVALLAVYLAARSGWDPQGLVQAAVAGLLHDVGELHIDPEILDAGRPLNADDHKFIYSHPVIAHAVLQAQPEYPPIIHKAVLEHHERLDGSGYPRALRGDAISELGQILAVAEVGSVLLRRWTDSGADVQVDVPLAMMRHKFHAYLLAFLRDLLALRDASPDLYPDVANTHRQLRIVGSTFAEWASMQAGLAAAGPGNQRVLAFLSARLARLRQSCLEAGLDPNNVDSFLGSLGNDASIQPAVAVLARETTWGLVEIMLETHRRWDEFDTDSPSARSMVLQWMSRTEQALA